MNPLKVCPQCGTEYPANARFCEIDGTALRSAGAEHDMVGSIVSDRYCILKKLGEGGMGQVYLAEHVKMGRKSALKVMHPGMVKDVDAISRFNREAANASRISHPNVAAVYDFGETSDGIIFLAMEFVDGPPLTKVIEQAGSLPPVRAAEIVRQTGDALAVAHDMGIVHRDLKPDNIMIARTRDGGDLVKVVDFGIAKAAGNDAQKVTKTGLVVGTPEYMSPEQLAGDKLDGRSDIYSLALVAFNMLTGRLPFPAESAQESMIMRLTDRPKPLAEMRPDVAWPADVQQVMDRALERDATLRYQTATEFGRELYRAIERMPETIAGGLGTQQMSVPPTRVGGAGPSAPGSASTSASPVAPTAAGVGTVSVPTPVSAASVTQAAAPPARKNLIAIVAGSAAVVIAAAVMALKFLGGGTPPNTLDTATPPASADSSASTTPSSTVVPDSSQGIKGQGTPAERTRTPTGSAPIVDVSQQLARLESAAGDSAKADTVMKQVNALWPSLTNDDERARGNYIRYLAVSSKNDGTKACTYIKEAVRLTGDAAKRSRWQIVVDNLEGCS